MSVNEGESQLSGYRTCLQPPPPAFQFCCISPRILFYMNFTSLSLCLIHFLTLFVCFFQYHSVSPTLSSTSLFFRLAYCIGNTVRLSYCTLPVEREFSFMSVLTPIILPSETDGSPGKQCSCQDTLLALQVRGHADSFTNIII